jgi:NADPH:quinone reductase-like Zn-dependent oxidoreductase
VFGEGIGTFADCAVASAEQLAAVPAGASFQEAAALPLAATTALLCLEQARLEPGSSVLTNGPSGGVGTFAVQAAKTLSLHLTAVASARNIDLVRSLGADPVIDYTTALPIRDSQATICLRSSSATVRSWSLLAVGMEVGHEARRPRSRR